MALMTRSALRSSIGLIFTAGWILVIGILALYLLDQRFSAAKRDRIVRDERYDPQMRQAAAAVSGIGRIRLTPQNEDTGLFFNVDSLVASDGVYYATRESEVFVFPVSDLMDQLHDEIAAALRKAIDGDNIFFRAEFYPCTESQSRMTAAGPAVTVEDAEKRRTLNTFSNNLLTRNFQNMVLYRMRMGNAVLYYTSPTDAEWMPGLVSRYRKYAAILLVLTLTAFVILLQEILFRFRSGRQAQADAGGVKEAHGDCN